MKNISKTIFIMIFFVNYSYCSEKKDKIEQISNSIVAYSCAIANNRRSLEDFLNYPITKKQLSKNEQQVLKRMQFNAERLCEEIKTVLNLF